LQDTGITNVRIKIYPSYGPRSLIDQLPDFTYIYILPKTNEISFNTDLLVIAYYVHSTM